MKSNQAGGGGDDGRGWCPPAEDEHDDDPIVEVRWETVVDVAKGRLPQLHPGRCDFSTAALMLLRKELRHDGAGEEAGGGAGEEGKSS